MSTPSFARCRGPVARTPEIFQPPRARRNACSSLPSRRSSRDLPCQSSRAVLRPSHRSRLPCPGLPPSATGAAARTDQTGRMRRVLPAPPSPTVTRRGRRVGSPGSRCDLQPADAVPALCFRNVLSTEAQVLPGTTGVAGLICPSCTRGRGYTPTPPCATSPTGSACRALASNGFSHSPSTQPRLSCGRMSTLLASDPSSSITGSSSPRGSRWEIIQLSSTLPLATS